MNRYAKNIILLVLLIISHFALLSQKKYHNQIPDLPAVPALVNDFAHMLNTWEVDTLEAKLLAFEKESSNEIAIVTVNNLGGMDISQFSVELGRKWEIGKKNKYNGVLILASKEERQIFIAPASGLQGVLPDMVCNKIVREDIVPNFKQGKFFEGFYQASEKIIGYTRGEFTTDASDRPDDLSSETITVIIILILIFIGIFVLAYLTKNDGTTYVSRRGYRNDRDDYWGGGFGGGSFGGGSSSSSGGFGGFGGGGGGFNGGGSGGSW
ncbi:MAG TPA: TPM domain-containing protein [Chitinophagaceae bacterium]|nr:MAG: beta-propeller domain-containing protein, methanol dehydrogenase [Bacteroidetes bacterium OLB11]HMN32823.1 TPM domain-containing protein [Chitinophagaceae bacterium]